jgi:hypothetical protein
MLCRRTKVSVKNCQDSKKTANIQRIRDEQCGRMRDAHLRRQLALEKEFRQMFRSVNDVHATKMAGSTDSSELEALRTLNLGEWRTHHAISKEDYH